MGLSGTFTFSNIHTCLCLNLQVTFYNFYDQCCFLGFFPEIFFYSICYLEFADYFATCYFWFCKIFSFPDVPFWDTFVKLRGWYFIFINQLLC